MRFCHYCGNHHPLCQFSSWEKPKGVIHHRTVCRGCASRLSREWYQANKARARARMKVYSASYQNATLNQLFTIRRGRPAKLPINGKLQCSVCSNWLSVESFHRNSRLSAGRVSQCKTCAKQRNKVINKISCGK